MTKFPLAGADIAHGIPRVGGLDLDDSGALFGEHHAREGGGDHGGEFEDGYPFEWVHHLASLMCLLCIAARGVAAGTPCNPRYRAQAPCKAMSNSGDWQTVAHR